MPMMCPVSSFKIRPAKVQANGRMCGVGTWRTKLVGWRQMQASWQPPAEHPSLLPLLMQPSAAHLAG